MKTATALGVNAPFSVGDTKLWLIYLRNEHKLTNRTKVPKNSARKIRSPSFLISGGFFLQEHPILNRFE
jgi:hypothetical protein